MILEAELIGMWKEAVVPGILAFARECPTNDANI
jgi:hypothetical protein